MCRGSEDQNVAPLDSQASQTTHAAVRSMLMPIRQRLDDVPVAPSLAAVFAVRAAAAGVVRALVPVDAGVVVDRSIGKLGDAGLAGTIFWERFTCLPCLSAVVTVNGVGEMVRPLLPTIARAVMPRRTNQSASVLAVTQGDAVVVHVHRRHAAIAVGMNHRIVLIPSLATVFANDQSMN